MLDRTLVLLIAPLQSKTILTRVEFLAYFDILSASSIEWCGGTRPSCQVKTVFAAQCSAPHYDAARNGHLSFPIFFRIKIPSSGVRTRFRRRKNPPCLRPSSDQTCNLTESKLDTHDVNLPLPSPDAPGTRYLRFLLLSSADQDPLARRLRIERLENQSGGGDAAIIWLLGEGSDDSSYLQLLNELVDTFEVPLLRLRSVEDLPDTLHKFHQSFLKSNSNQHNSTWTTQAVQTLLPYTGLSPPLRQHTTNLLTDLTMGFANLANMAGTETGQSELVEYLGREEAGRVVSFWTKEYLA